MNKPNLDSVCQAVMEELLKHGFQYEVPEDQIEASIFFIRGIDKRTCRRWIEVMEKLEYIKESRTLPIRGTRGKIVKVKRIYEMNVVKVPHLFQILKSQPQAKIA